MNKGIATLLFVLCLHAAMAQTADKAKLDSFFEALQQNSKWMGSVAVAKGGKLLYTKSVGYSEAATMTPANENTRFRIGSISKTFTTVLIFKAIESGKLSLTQTLDKYFPTIPNASKITIGQMLNHHSGIHNFTTDSLYTTYYTQPQTEAAQVARIVKDGSDFEPGSKADYSNSNFVLLSYILQSIYKKPYDTLLQEQILKPLNLQHTAFGGPVNTKNNDSYSYARESDHWVTEKETDMSIPMGAGAVISTPSDLCRFANALFTGKLVSAGSLAQMEKLQDGYGMGLFPTPTAGKTGYGHNGGIDGFSSEFSYYLADSTAYALTSNGGDFKNSLVTKAMQNWMDGKPITIPHFTTYAVTAADLDQYLGIYSSKEFPLKVTITKQGNTLITQATGQSALAMTATAKDVFEFDKAGIVLTFKPAEKQMVLNQGGRTIVFVRE